ncbi:MAG: hypothetical protein NTX86_04630 [Candidatus Dependentiae bacterium]|nr:hypothetical protein [Candidatus Dependentiae bacterium]
MNPFYLVIAIALSIVMPLSGIDNHHFYRASFLFAEPRLEKDWLTTADIVLAGGSTKKGRNCLGKLVPLFDIYGTCNMRVLGNGVPNKDSSNPADAALIALSQTEANGCFAHLSFPGYFKVIESDIVLYQNFTHGLFTQFYMPVRRFKIHPQHFFDLSQTHSVPAWNNFLTKFNAILARYDLSLCPIEQSAIGDISLLLGWTINYEKATTLDFIDFTIKGGILTPSGTARSEHCVFDISSGYDKHVGFPVICDLSIGAYEWLTTGLHIGVLPFLNRCKNMRIKTDYLQQGLITLAQDRATVHQGPLWDIGAFFKWDHIAERFSCTLGYTFAQKTRDYITPHDPIFSATIASSDARLQGWQMHTVHLAFEYDFSNQDELVGPRIGLLFNAQCAGKKVFKNYTAGGYFGLDLSWTI